MEADVAIQLEKPERPEVKVVRLGRMHIYPFASQQYIDSYGLPKDLSEIRQHRIVHQKGPQVEDGSAQRLLNLPSIEGVIALRTNASIAHACAVELGMGIGGLGTYIVALGSDLVPVDIGVRHHVDIWMTYHPDARSVRRVSLFIDWLKTLFDPKLYPWFGDEFIHPRDMQQARAPASATAAFNLPFLKPARRLKTG
jgi:DNA-binding transcriptional LysR family regulator